MNLLTQLFSQKRLMENCKCVRAEWDEGHSLVVQCCGHCCLGRRPVGQFLPPRLPKSLFALGWAGKAFCKSQVFWYLVFWGERDIKVHILRHRRSPLSFSTRGASGLGGLCQRTAVSSPQRGQRQPVFSEHQGKVLSRESSVHLY